MPDSGNPDAREQRLDFALLRAVKHRGAEPDAVIHARGYAQQHLVVQLFQLPQRGCSRKLLADKLARGLHVVVLADQVGYLFPQPMRGPAQMRLQDLAHIHTRRHAQRVQDNFNRGAVGQVRHVFLGQNARR